MIGMTSRGSYINARFVIAATKKWSKQVLSRQGAYVRGIAKRKIRRRKNPKKYSPAGTPPFTHTGALKKSVIFAASEESVVIGPSYSEIGHIGHTHEFGGTEPEKKSRQKKNNWRLVVGGHGPVAIRNGKPVIARLRTATQVKRAREIAGKIPAGMTMYKPRRTYPKRAFMGPSLQEARQELPSFWRNSVSKSA